MPRLPILIIAPILLVAACGSDEDYFQYSRPPAYNRGENKSAFTNTGNGGWQTYESQPTAVYADDSAPSSTREFSGGQPSHGGATSKSNATNGSGSATTMPASNGGSRSSFASGSTTVDTNGGFTSDPNSNITRGGTASSFFTEGIGFIPQPGTGGSMASTNLGTSVGGSSNGTDAPAVRVPPPGFDNIPCVTDAQCAQGEICSQTNVSAELAAEGVGRCVSAL